MKTRFAICAVILLAIGGLAIWLDPTNVLWGVLNRESFYRNRPTSYWRNQIKRANADANTAFGINFGAKRDPSGVPVLRELLDDQDIEVCFFACNALSLNGSRAKAAVPDLAALLAHPNIHHRRNASLALASIVERGDKTAITPLIRGLNEEDNFVNYHCAIALGKIGPVSKEALPVLRKLQDCDRANLDIFNTESDEMTLAHACGWAINEIDAKSINRKVGPAR